MTYFEFLLLLTKKKSHRGELKSYRQSPQVGNTVIGLCATRWPETELHSGKSIVYSGHPYGNTPHTEETAFMLSKDEEGLHQLGANQFKDHHGKIFNNP